MPLSGAGLGRALGHQFRWRVLLWLGLLFAPWPAYPLTAPEGLRAEPLQVLEDPDGHASLDQVLARDADFRQVLVETPNYGFTRSAYWFRTRVGNHGHGAAQLLLDLRHSTLDEATLFVLRGGALRERILTGDRIAAVNRPAAGNFLLLPFRLPARESVDLYLRVRSLAGSMLVPMALLDEAGLRDEQLSARLLDGAIMGLFFGLFVYNLLVCVLLRERAYLYYVLYLPSAYLSVSALNGFGPAVLYPHWTWPGNEGLLLFAGLTFLLIVAFTRALLRTRDYPWVDRLALAMMVPFACLMVSPFTLPIQYAYRFGHSLMFLFPLVFMAVGVVAWRHGRTEARFYITGQAASWLGLVAFALLVAGLLPYHLLLLQSIVLGIAADALLLSLALADRIRRLQGEKRQAEREARDNLALRQQELERIVAERTAELEEARREAERLATIDPLTGLYNRRGVLDRAARELQLALREQRPLAAVMLDIDHFKRINDQHGHALGDEVMQRLARVVGETMRSTDLFGRVGGEEFLLVLPNTVAADAVTLAERLRLRVEQEVGSGVLPTAVTASFGIAGIGPRLTTLDTLQAAADAALYTAKERGRNRVECDPGLELLRAAPGPKSVGQSKPAAIAPR